MIKRRRGLNLAITSLITQKLDDLLLFYFYPSISLTIFKNNQRQSIFDDLTSYNDSRRVHWLVGLRCLLPFVALIELVSHPEAIQVHPSMAPRIVANDWVRIFGLNLASLPEKERSEHGESSDCHEEIFQFAIESSVVFLLFWGQFIGVKVRLLALETLIKFFIKFMKKPLFIVILSDPWVDQDLIGLKEFCISTIRAFIAVVLVLDEETSVSPIDLLK